MPRGQLQDSPRNHRPLGNERRTTARPHAQAVPESSRSGLELSRNRPGIVLELTWNCPPPYEVDQLQGSPRSTGSVLPNPAQLAGSGSTRPAHALRGAAPCLGRRREARGGVGEYPPGVCRDCRRADQGPKGRRAPDARPSGGGGARVHGSRGPCLALCASCGACVRGRLGVRDSREGLALQGPLRPAGAAPRKAAGGAGRLPIHR